MSRTLHMALDIEGFMSNAAFPKDYRGMFKHDDGRPMAPDEARAELFNQLRRGRKMLPMGACDNFCFQTGCKGHDTESATITKVSDADD